MMNQLNTLGQELASGQAAQTYSGLQSQAGVALALNAQLSALTGYSGTASTVGTTLSVAQSVLTQLGTASSSMMQAINQQETFQLNGNGQTTTQATAAAQLDNILSLLNTQVGSSYIFSGSGPNQQSVASVADILNGNGAQAGLTQMITERQQADLGASGLGHVSATVGGVGSSTVTLSQDGTPFGFQLTGVNSSLTGATVTGPSGSPTSISVDLGSNPNPGDAIQFQLTLPDGSTQTISLQATTSSPPGVNQFTIGTAPANTATNLQTALTAAVTGLTQTALPAASAMAAANNFFSDPPQRVNGSPPDTSTALVNGTSANTVFWYTGENGSTPARQTATAQVGPSITIDYGMRANEQALTTLVENVAVLAAATYSPTDPNAQTNYHSLSQKVAANLNGQPGTQQISDIEADLANAQTTVTNAATLNTQTQTTLQDMLQNIDGVNQNQIGEDILTLQNSLSASMSVTARLAQLSLVNYLSPVNG
ncbi:MAG TPA: flagellar biosynthesis protein FlgL [Xanthobacteraceae bacterium]|nr:flagellar biosynthesis protein FlgL [Xanthobacteraceae bacterium]